MHTNGERKIFWKRLSFYIVIVLTVMGLSGCENGSDTPVYYERPADYEKTPDLEKIDIIGESAPHGVYDPSIEYHDGTGWMTYSAVDAPKYVHTQLAKSSDHGKTWTHVNTINKSINTTLVTKEGTLNGVWRHEVSTLVHDPGDPGREWKLFWHKYFTRPPFEEEDRMFQYGWIAYKYAPHPEGPWSREVDLFGSTVIYPSRICEPLINLNKLDTSLGEVAVYTEPGSLMKDDTLYLTLNGHTIQKGENIGKIFLFASHDHGQTWEYINVLLEPEDARDYKSLFFTGSSLAEEDGRVFLLACPEDPSSKMHHRGTCIFEFEDITKGILKQDSSGTPIVYKYLVPLNSGGQSDYDEHNTYGGIVMPQIDVADYPEVFQIFNTKEKIGS